MPRVTRYKRGPSHESMKGLVIGIPGIPGTAWWVGKRTRYRNKSTVAQMVSLPSGHVNEDYWNTTMNRLETGMLQMVSSKVYVRWQDAAWDLYKEANEHTMISCAECLKQVSADRAAALVAVIEGTGADEPC